MKKFTKVLALLIAGMFLVIGCSKNESQKVRKPSANIDSSKTDLQPYLGVGGGCR